MAVPEQQFVTLNNGVKMPAIGLGCWSGLTDEEHESALPWLLTALKTGYRHLDTAYGYGTEGVVGKAVRASGIPRDEIFVTTKLPQEHHAKVAESYQISLDRAGFDYYDLWLMHFPQAMPDIPENPDFITLEHPTFNETWADMEKVYEAGIVKAIGVSNFSVKNLKILFETAKIVPAVNQIEMHPHQAQPELLKYCNEKGIILTAYSPSGYSGVATDPTVMKIAEKHGVSPAQVSLAWHVARGTTAVPKSTNADRQRANLLELPKLSEEDMAELNTLHKDVHYCNTPGPKFMNGQKAAMGWTYEQMGW